MIFSRAKKPDLENHTHILHPTLNEGWDKRMTSSDVVDLAMLNGERVYAMCGYSWIPKASMSTDKSCLPCIEAALAFVKMKEKT